MSPDLPVSITLSVSACSMTCNVVGCVTARLPANETVSAVPITTSAIAPMNSGFFFIVVPLPEGPVGPSARGYTGRRIRADVSCRKARGHRDLPTFRAVACVAGCSVIEPIRRE